MSPRCESISVGCEQGARGWIRCDPARAQRRGIRPKAPQPPWAEAWPTGFRDRWGRGVQPCSCLVADFQSAASATAKDPALTSWAKECRAFGPGAARFEQSLGILPFKRLPGQAFGAQRPQQTSLSCPLRTSRSRYTPTGNHTGQPPANLAQHPIRGLLRSARSARLPPDGPGSGAQSESQITEELLPPLRSHQM